MMRIRLTLWFGFATGNIQSDAHIPTRFPGQFPSKLYLSTAGGMLLHKSDEVHLLGIDTYRPISQPAKRSTCRVTVIEM